MPQNIYDNPDFFAAYGELGRSVAGLDGAAEWPALQALLPDISGARVLDLGCGFGWFCRWARAHGAASVLGIDVSEKMRARDRRHGRHGDSLHARGPRRGLAQGVIKQHRTIGTYVNALLDVGFRLTRLVEWAPTDAQIVERPELLDERARPMFLLLAAVRI
jgi:SAM-dependent methyltransferase